MTIQEIARLAGVSPATVSRFFNKPISLSPALRAQVKAVVEEHHYHPRLTGNQRNVVIILPYNAVYPVQSCVDMLLMSLTQALPLHDFRMEILPLNSLDRLQSIQFCAAVAIGVDSAAFQDWGERFPVPLIILDRDMTPIPNHVYIIRSDEAQGMELAIRHFAEKGCTKTGVIIHGEPGLGNASVRHNAVLQALKRHKLPCDDNLIQFSGTDDSKYVELIGRLLRHGIDSLFCPGGNAGILAMYALSLFNRNVPNDLSLITSEQTFYSAYGVPPQTTITPQYAELANKAAEAIETLIDNGKHPQRITLPYSLITRESVRGNG